jgi:hypothetical protein
MEQAGMLRKIRPFTPAEAIGQNETPFGDMAPWLQWTLSISSVISAKKYPGSTSSEAFTSSLVAALYFGRTPLNNKASLM